MSQSSQLLSDETRTKPWQESAVGLRHLPRASHSVTAASLTINLLSLALPAVLLQIYDRIIPNTATDTLLILIIGLCGALFLDATLRIARSSLLAWQAAQFELKASCQAAKRTLAADVGAFEKDAPGVHLDRLNAIDTLRDYIAGQTRVLIVDLPFVLLFLLLIAYIGGAIVVVPLVALVFLGAAAFFVGQRLKRALRVRSDLDDRRYSFIIEVLTGITTVKGLAMEPLIQRRYDRLQEASAQRTSDVTFFSNLAQSLGAVFSNMTMVGVGALGAVMVIEGQLSIGGLAACTLLSGRSVQPPLRALSLWTQFQNITLARENLEQTFDLPQESASGAEVVEEIEGQIELRGVSFGYGEEAPLLRQIDLRIEKGEVIALKGDTGSGKSTLLQLVIGTLKPTSGEILFDGRRAATLNGHSLRRQIAFMPQTAVLFRGTIMDNLTAFGGSAKIEDALEAAQLLRLDAAINRLPAGYETRVGDGAFETLPTGLQQGIVIARALAGNPRIILFDEANSGLDQRSDRVLQAAIDALRGRSTIILISHRPSLLAIADRQFQLSGGHLELLAAGTPQSLGDRAS